MVLETLEFGWEKKTNIFTYAIRWPRVDVYNMNQRSYYLGVAQIE